eukprot:CAMPEP_0116144448 /NCGR_PEP_ID=MMETSP0329-20121206/16011_1 /TAXON_ID=697910 /ORGANISM="Pseudo-nitzschia arenysensis, Strain B593" /LENGTH=564 /DNA_ID=CAMNT_0003639879 /DNA_START=95 /DNA_END=1789 /DNA_ORIENTATION=-
MSDTGRFSAGASTRCAILRIEEKENCFPRQYRSRIRGNISFTVVFWVTEVALFLLLNSCDGFAPMGYNSQTLWTFPSTTLNQRQAEKKLRQWDHRTSQVKLAKTSNIYTSSISSILVSEEDKNKTKGVCDAGYSTESMVLSLDLPPLKESRRRRAWNAIKKKKMFWRNAEIEYENISAKTLDFAYDYDVIDIKPTSNGPSKVKTTGVLLIHPIGVGISRWYYQRLVSSLVAKQASARDRIVIVVPDLLGSGSACNATIGEDIAQKFPLFNISDWTDQLEALMSSVEETQAPPKSCKIDEWCLVANGGCSPIALQLAERKDLKAKKNSSETPITNLILSSVPRLPFFLKNETTNDPSKVAKSYRTLSGIAGNLFWWYSCRNEGAFIQKFSEKNLIADPKNLGPTWRSNCYETAISFGGKGKYATFSFLAGTLQDGCLPSLEAIKNSSLRINIIKGADVRRNRAKSWFWQKPKKETTKKSGKNPNTVDEKTLESEQDSDATEAMATTSGGTNNVDHPTVQPYETFREYAKKNGNGGKELTIAGRISLAHEDPEGYAGALLHFLFGI